MKKSSQPKLKLIGGFEVRKNKKGNAVFAGRDYRKGEFVHRLNGAAHEPRFLSYTAEDFKRALFHPLQIGPARYLRLDAPSIYFNHACEPNMGVRGRSDLYALRAIKKGEELTYDYATTIDESFECLCGSKKCRRTIGDFFTLPHRTQRWYLEHNALPDFIKKKLIRLSKGGKKSQKRVTSRGNS